jgi:hypothetical protein
MTPADIAGICHEANRALCQTQGDYSQPAWADAPAWQRVSAIQGVETAIADPAATPESMHHNWCEHKIADGWHWGPVKDPEAKEHPCLVDYQELPPAQRAKDHLFLAIVRALAAQPD